MIGFKVSLNGKRLYTAAAGARGVMTACVTWVFREAPGVRNRSDLSLQVGGLAKDAHLNWASPRKLKVGDKVVVTIVDTKKPDPPSRTKRDDAALVEASERQYYERLKAKYEPSKSSSGGSESRRRTTRG
jgi:hypothetical protein